MVERSAVNRLVVGSNPTSGANLKMFSVYILQNSKGAFYIGMTDNVARRLTQHNSRKSKWTKSRGPWRVVWTSGPLSPSEARKLETKLKRQKGGDGLYKITGLARVAVNPAAAGS